MKPVYCMNCGELVKECEILEKIDADFMKVQYSCPNCFSVIKLILSHDMIADVNKPKVA